MEDYGVSLYCTCTCVVYTTLKCDAQVISVFYPSLPPSPAISFRGLLPQSDTSGSMAAASFSDHPSSDMTVGCTVRLKDGPKYGGGALVFRHHPQYGPQVGFGYGCE